MVIWIIGLSGSGKTTTGKILYKNIKKKYSNTVFLDGDILRGVWEKKLGHNLSDRKINAKRILNLCKLLDKQKINVVCCLLSIFPNIQKKARKIFKNYYQFYLKVPIKILKKRDTKKIYKKFYSKKINNVVGLDIPFPKPYRSDITLKSFGKNTPQKIAKKMMGKIKFL